MRILVVEDNVDLNNAIVKLLKENYLSVDTVFDGEEALYYLESASYDVVILDVMLPKLDGFEVLEKMRGMGNTTPVLFLTARTSTQDLVKGLNLGGDDYLTKPFKGEELLARLKVLVRRKTGHVDNIYTCGPLTLNSSTYQVTLFDKPVELSQKEFGILEYLIQHQNIIVSREQLLEHVWDFDYMGSSNIIDVYVNYLRKKLRNDETKLIVTQRGMGYILRSDDAS